LARTEKLLKVAAPRDGRGVLLRDVVFDGFDDAEFEEIDHQLTRGGGAGGRNRESAGARGRG